ncbi:hypothetical protein CEXT_657831 [Caerostris extrusa]|uniref:Reverse transcriptase n=1 Tax=Caerostris extrusa TaxID=172846 RepID=A0AAV4WW19_CAEEX|nr:hypothetical protein CEXT_657831 [Caerostris extrusa]
MLTSAMSLDVSNVFDRLWHDDGLIFSETKSMTPQIKATLINSTQSSQVRNRTLKVIIVYSHIRQIKAFWHSSFCQTKKIQTSKKDVCPKRKWLYGVYLGWAKLLHFITAMARARRSQLGRSASSQL